MPTKAEQAVILRDAFNLPPEEAIAFLESKGMKITWSWREAMDLAAQQSFTVAKAMRMDILQDIRGAVEKSVAQGETFYDFRKNLEPTLRAKGWWGKVNGAQLGSPHRLKTIYRTNMQSALQAGRYDQQMESAPSDGWLRYVAILDQSTRSSHSAMDGFQRPASDPIWNRIYPPNGFNCFVPDTEIIGTYSGAAKMLYHGKTITIETNKGSRLTVTANHPIATDRGFIKAANLRKGFNVFRYGGGGEIKVNPVSTSFPTGNNENIPSRIKEVFELFSIMGPLLRTAITPKDFYGDAEFGDGYVDTIDIDGKLLNSVKTYTHSNRSNLRLKPSDVADVSHITLGKFDFCLERFFGSSDGVPSLSTLADYGRSIRLQLAPFKKLCLSSSPGRDAILSENSINDISGYSEIFGKLLHGSSGIISLDEITGIFENDFRGHVYDLQSSSGLIIAQNIVTCNCRCRVIELDADEAMDSGGASPLMMIPPGFPDEGFGTKPGLNIFHLQPSDYDPDIYRAGEQE